MNGIDTLEIYHDLKSFSEEQSQELTDIINKVFRNFQQESDRRQFEKLVTKEDFSHLKNVLDNLADTQERTDERLNALAIAQENTERSLNALAIAQEKTEQQLLKLTRTVGKLQKEVGGLSNTYGYVLEDRAIKTLPRLLKKNCNIDVREMKRDYIEYDEINFDEINILGTGIKDNKDILIIGEAKYQLSRKHINQFLRVIKRVKSVKELPIFPLMVCASAAPGIRNYAKEYGIALYYSYQLDL